MADTAQYSAVSTGAGGGQNPAMTQVQAKAGQMVEQASKKFGGMWKMIFFLSAACTCSGGIIAIISAVFTMETPFDFIMQVYLAIFGIIMMVIDAPFDNNKLKDFKMEVYKYARFMTRFVGRGVWYLFLGSMVFGALFENEMCPWIGFPLGLFVCVSGGVAIFYGVRLTNRLEQVRKRVLEQGPEQWGAYIPPAGMTKVQFRELSASLKGIVFNEEELNYIVDAFSDTVRSDDIISKEEFEEWTKGGMTVL